MHPPTRRLFDRATLIAAVASVGSTARAHERDFAFSRDWHLPYKGEFEVESRTFWKDRHNDLLQQFEAEYGIADHFAIEPGLALKRENADEFKVESADLELRFNFREFGYGKLLPGFNLEYERRIEDENGAGGANAEEEPKNDVELKSLVSWYSEAGDDLTLNLNLGRGFGGEGESEWETELTAGWVRPFDLFGGTPGGKHEFKAGVELVRQMIQEHGLGVGPVITWRATEHLHLVATALIALRERDENSDEFRLILEWEF